MTRRYRATTFSIAFAGALAIAACSTDDGGGATVCTEVTLPGKDRIAGQLWVVGDLYFVGAFLKPSGASAPKPEQPLKNCRSRDYLHSALS